MSFGVSGAGGVFGGGSVSGAWARADGVGGLRGAQERFQSLLGRGSTEAVGETAEDRARHAAEELVALSLVQPVLKELRESEWAWGPFKASRGERQLREMMDADLSQRIVRAEGFGLVEGLARKMLGHMGSEWVGGGVDEVA